MTGEPGSQALENFLRSGDSNIVNLLRIPGEQQVMLKVTVAEISRSAARSIGLNFSITNHSGIQVFAQNTGSLATTISGLVGVTPIADSVTIGDFDITAPVVDADTHVYHVAVAAGTRAARFSLDAVDNGADLDLFVYKGGTLVALSASGAADEGILIGIDATGPVEEITERALAALRPFAR